MSDLSIVGESVARPDALGKVTGGARYAGDLSLPGMLHAKTKRSTVAHARIRRIDASRALAYPGVRAVLTHHDVPRVLHYGSPHPRSASLARDQYILDSKVRYWGESVAVVAAESEEIAEEALDLIEVEYEELPAAFTVEQALSGSVLIHETKNNLVADPVVIRRGDVERGFAEADLVVEGTYQMGRPTPAYMEPNVCVAQWNEDRLTMWISTQTPFMVRGILAEVLGLPHTKVRVIVDHMGGGFGAKQDLFQTEFLCALLARKAGRPVRLEFTRKETFLGGRSRHPGTVWLKQGFRKDGTITARQARVTLNSGAYGSHGPGVTAVGTTALTSLYRCENVLLEGKCVYTNTPIAGAYRGYGVVQTYYALDIQMEEAAERLGIDPVALKLKNAVREGDLSPSGHPIIGHGLEDCIRRGMQETDWKKNRGQAPNSKKNRGQTPKSENQQKSGSDPIRRDPIRRGWGMGCEMHGSSAYPGIKEQGNATVRMNEDGTVQLFTGTTGLGTGAHTALAQIVAEELGVRFEDVSVVHGDTDVVPWDIGAFASHTTYMGGRVAQMAAAQVRQQVLALAAEALEAAPQDLEFQKGIIKVKGSDRRLSVRDAVRPKKGIPSVQLIASATYQPTKSYSFAAHFVEVQVDTETGQVDVLQVVPVHEVGKVIHPVAAAGQIEGGIQQGIGHTLTEDYVIDLANGRSLNAGFVDYKMPLSLDMPPIRTILLETAPDPGGPFGAKGVGEDPIIAIGPAIANAIYDAIGVRFRHYPITPEQVLEGLRSKP